MNLQKIISILPAILIPSAWLVTLLNYYEFVGLRSIEIMHIVMLIFLPVFLYVGWDRLNKGVLKTWRNVILAGLIFTILGSAGVFLNLGASITFFPELIYWALVPGIATVYTSKKAEWNKNLLYSGILGVIGGILFTIYIYTGFVPLWVGVFTVAIAQKYSIITAIRMDN